MLRKLVLAVLIVAAAVAGCGNESVPELTGAEVASVDAQVQEAEPQVVTVDGQVEETEPVELPSNDASLGDDAGDGADDDDDALTDTSTEVADSNSVDPTTEPVDTGEAEIATTEDRPAFVAPTFESLDDYAIISDFAGSLDAGLNRWFSEVPEIQDLRLVSTMDGSEQPLLWLPPDSDGPAPLLVILHSWSTDYSQHAGIPYAKWADENGWAVVAPNFRGINDGVDSTGSDLAVQDVVDAIAFATNDTGVDSSRVYAVGYSGGGMMALLLAGQHPDVVTAVAAWGPPADLAVFSAHSNASGFRYGADIAVACGGDPNNNNAAAAQCLSRSAVSYLDSDNPVGIYLGHGLDDTLVQPSQSAVVFNLLADVDDRLDDDAVNALGNNRLPDEDDLVATESFLQDVDPAAQFARSSGETTVVFFAGGHDMAYRASARFFASDPGEQ